MDSNKNIKYSSLELIDYYCENRSKWDDVYPSEKHVFEKIAAERDGLGDIFDVGCACGGLCSSLHTKFKINSYTGIDINNEMIDWARKERRVDIPVEFISGDVLEIELAKKFDTVVSLSCADWNIKTEDIINDCWGKVKEEGYFIISLRLTAEESINDIKKSYQLINFSGDNKNPEKANYVVFNINDILDLFKGLVPKPVIIGSYGYWGKPSETAVTLYDKLVFAVFYIKKAKNDNLDIKIQFDLPDDIIENIK